MKQRSQTGDGFPNLRRQSLREQVEEALEDLIVYGTLKPGERLAEEQLAGQLGVSRQPVREALHALSAVGFVDSAPGKGAFVHRPTAKEAKDVFHVRSLLESDSAGRAATLASEADIRELEGIYADGLRLVETGADPRELLDLNARFHDTIMEIDANETSISFMRDLRRRIGWYLATIIEMRAPSSWEEHREILEAIKSGSPDRAQAAMSKHVYQSLELMDFVDI